MTRVVKGEKTVIRCRGNRRCRRREGVEPGRKRAAQPKPLPGHSSRWNQASSPLRKRNVTGTPARVAMRCGFFVPAQCRWAWVPCKLSAPLAGRIRIRPDAPCASAVGHGSDNRGEVLNWAATPALSTDEERHTKATRKK